MLSLLEYCNVQSWYFGQACYVLAAYSLLFSSKAEIVPKLQFQYKIIWFNPHVTEYWLNILFHHKRGPKNTIAEISHFYLRGSTIKFFISTE